MHLMWKKIYLILGPFKETYLVLSRQAIPDKFILTSAEFPTSAKYPEGTHDGRGDVTAPSDTHIQYLWQL